MPPKNIPKGRRRPAPSDGRLFMTILYHAGMRETGVVVDKEGTYWVYLDIITTKYTRGLAEAKEALLRLARHGFIYDLVAYSSRYYSMRIRTPAEYEAYQDGPKDLEAPLLVEKLSEQAMRRKGIQTSKLSTKNG